jgi:hypothetical protein
MLFAMAGRVRSIELQDGLFYGKIAAICVTHAMRSGLETVVRKEKHSMGDAYQVLAHIFCTVVNSYLTGNDKANPTRYSSSAFDEHPHQNNHAPSDTHLHDPSRSRDGAGRYPTRSGRIRRRPRRLSADRGYDAHGIRHWLRLHEIQPIIRHGGALASANGGIQ